MPYKTISDLPKQFASLPDHAKKIALEVINSSLSYNLSEDRAFKSAWGAIKKSYKESEDGTWVQKSMDNLQFDIYPDKFEYKTENENYYVKGILEIAGYVDTQSDMVTKECIYDMATQIKGKDVKAIFKGNLEHEQALVDRRIVSRAKVIDVEIKGNQLIITTMLNKHHPEFTSLWGSITDGFIDAFSMEFKPLEYMPKTNRTPRILNKVKLGGIAFTGRPACEDCKITDFFIKSKAIGNDEQELINLEVDKMEDVTKTEEITVDTLNKQVDELKSAIVLKDKEILELKSKVDTKIEVKTITADEIKSIVNEAIATIRPSKPLVEAPEKFETKSTEPQTLVERIMMSKGIK